MSSTEHKKDAALAEKVAAHEEFARLCLSSGTSLHESDTSAERCRQADAAWEAVWA